MNSFFDSINRDTQLNEGTNHARYSPMRLKKKTPKIYPLASRGCPFNIADCRVVPSYFKSWKRCITDIDSVLFVAGITLYDKVLWEENKTMTGMYETRIQFKSLCNSQWLAKSDVLLFFHNVDVFESRFQIILAKRISTSRNPAFVTEFCAHIKSMIRFTCVTKTRRALEDWLLK